MSTDFDYEHYHIHLDKKDASKNDPTALAGYEIYLEPHPNWPGTDPNRRSSGTTWTRWKPSPRSSKTCWSA